MININTNLIDNGALICQSYDDFLRQNYMYHPQISCIKYIFLVICLIFGIYLLYKKIKKEKISRKIIIFFIINLIIEILSWIIKIPK
jgi:hypothetical protein